MNTFGVIFAFILSATLAVSLVAGSGSGSRSDSDSGRQQQRIRRRRPRCPNIHAPQYGYIISGYRNKYKAGHVVVFGCNKGYQLQGRGSIKCRAGRNSAYWNYKLPVCIKVFKPTAPECEDLDAPQYGSVTLTGVKVGSNARYSCNEGFVLKGNARRTCQGNGQWSGSAPTCERKVVVVVCPTLNDPQNGDVDLNGVRVGSKARYLCDNGFKLRGNRKRKCQSNGQWSGSDAVCERIPTCPQLNDPDNGNVDVGGQTIGSEARYSCDDDFKLRGNQVRKCQSNGQWSGSDAVCERIPTCPQLNDPENGNVDVGGQTIGSKARYSCDDGFKLRGNRKRRCQSNGQWSGSDAVCEKVITCPVLKDPDYGKVDLKGQQVGSKAKYSCDDGFKLRGNRVRRCQSNGQWSGSDAVCEKIIIVVKCPQLNDPKNGNVSLKGLTVGSKAKYSCFPGYELDGTQLRRCQSNGQWSGHAPFCTYQKYH